MGGGGGEKSLMPVNVAEVADLTLAVRGTAANVAEVADLTRLAPTSVKEVRCRSAVKPSCWARWPVTGQ